MAKVEIYTSPFCGYCHRAKHLLGERGAEFHEIDVLANPAKRPEMVSRANGRSTVPQIFINGIHVGGCDDLYALDRRGELKAMLEQPA